MEPPNKRGSEVSDGKFEDPAKRPKPDPAAAAIIPKPAEKESKSVSGPGTGTVPTAGEKPKEESPPPEKPRKLTADTEESAKKNKEASAIEQKQAAIELFNSAALPTEVFERDKEKDLLIGFLQQ